MSSSDKCDNMLLYDVLSGLNDFASIWIRRFREENRNIYLFGAGLAGQVFSYTFQKYGIKLTAFCDNNPQKVGKIVSGIPVISFNEMLKDSNKFVVICAVDAFWQLIKQCYGAGIPADDICHVDWLWYNDSDKKLMMSKVDTIMEAYTHCKDGLSRSTYITALMNRCIRDRRFYKEIKCDGTMYFDNRILKLNQNAEVFVDCGAAYGDTALQFLEVFGGKVYAFEPDKVEYQKLLNNVRHTPNIIPANAGLGEVTSKKSFNTFDNGGFGMGGLFEEGGTEIAQVCTIDEAVSEVPTFIKMDIQGYEMNALRGAEKTISKYKPKMAICIYHKTSDFLDVPEYVLSLRPDYDMYIRHYRSDIGDTVCYFV